MSVQSEPSSSVLDSIKLLFSLLLVVSAIGGFYYYAEYSLLYRVLGLIGVCVISLALSLATPQGRMLWGFCTGARTEIRKVVWPTRAETVQTTLIVMLMVTVVGIILWLLDMFFLWGVRLLTGQGS